jgi:Lrp/AsnC family leucine-responsive transcriptional regulator
MKGKYDNIDLMILNELRENCKKPVKEIARKLHIHPNTLLMRVKKLEKEKVIVKYQAEIDYRKLGYELHVIVMVRVRKGRAGDPEQLADLSSIPEIQALYACTGMYDVIAVARVKDRDELVKVLRKIGENEIVTKTTTHIILYPYKNPYEYNPLEVFEFKKK